MNTNNSSQEIDLKTYSQDSDKLIFFPKPKKSGKKLFSNIQDYIVDKASGFDYNS